MSMMIKFSQEVLSRYDEERGDRLLFLITRVADEWNIDIETIADYLTPNMVDRLQNESKNHNLLTKIPANLQTYELF